MKAAAFLYVRATTLAHALTLLATHGENARLIAGGQSLVPALNLRLLAPDILIDISKLAELHGISDHAGGLLIGAMIRHADVLASSLVRERCPLLAEALRHVAHPAIRNRGTIGGNLAHADPASELPACMLALGATLVISGQNGERRVAAADFFTGIFETALLPGDILTAIEVPAPVTGQKTGFSELARRHGDFALTGLACRAVVNAEGALSDIRLAYFGVGDRPVLAVQSAAKLKGASVNAVDFAGARAALSQDLEPQDDLHASGAMRLHLAGVLLERVVGGLLGVPDTHGMRVSA